MPKYSFCEGVHAGPRSPWHIRKLSREGLKPSGGLDTTTLCGKIAPNGVKMAGGRTGWGGWDLEVEITAAHLDRKWENGNPLCCKDCAAAYRRYKKAHPG